MSRSFDFKKYKAIIDFINSSTGEISTSISNLIGGTIEMRKNSVASIVKFSTEISEVVIGRIKTTIGSEKYVSDSDISIDVTNNGEVVFGSEYEYHEKSMLPKILPVAAINMIAAYYIKKNVDTTELSRKYDASVDSFSLPDVPNIKYLKDNFVTMLDGTLGGKIVISSDSASKDTDTVSLSIANILAGTSISGKKIDVSVKNLVTNFFDYSEGDGVTFTASPTKIIVANGVTIKTAPSEKSILSSSNIHTAAILKNMSNIKKTSMIPSSSDSTALEVADNAMSSFADAGIVTQQVTTIPKECSPSYNSEVIHVGLIPENDSRKDMIDLMSIENFMNQSDVPESTDDINQKFVNVFSILPTGVSDVEFSSTRGRMATSLKSIYELVVSRLLIENKQLFISEREYNNQQSILSLMLTSTSSPDFARRPLLKNSSGDIATSLELSQIVDGIDFSESSGIVRSW
jgi:chemotaxis protein CheY-P-specific phosphatase CheC